uniref:Uncharacterized protein n=1 Tax=Rhodnius prolixus TaxID=13249 RepID=A0A4P6DA07_RHOPR
MSENRIQKLLFNEYSDFEDIVLIESPFAQTTKDGTGVRQVQMGLTPTKLILAGDIIEKFDPRIQIDPDTGTLELLSLFPVECVNMSVYRRKNRNTLKAHFCNDQVIYFELAGSFKREMFWNLWCERIKFLNPEDESPVSTYSETSVGSTSVSTSTAYGNKAKKDLWDTKDLFLGENFGQGESTVERKPKGQSHIPREKDIGDKRISGRSQVCLVNRFGHGISENCSTNLFLPVQIYVTPNFDQATQNSADLERENTTMVMKNSFAREPIIFWEGQRPQVKHRRRYGIIPQGFLFCGLGKINIDRPQLLSLQLKRCCSEVYISNYDSEIEDISRLPKRLLTSSLSCDCLIENQRNNEADHDPVRGSSKYNFYQGEYFFWTPNFWYRPMNARYGYKKLMQHLENLQQYHKIEDMKQRNLLLWNMVPLKSESEEDTTQRVYYFQKIKLAYILTI